VLSFWVRPLGIRTSGIFAFVGWIAEWDSRFRKGKMCCYFSNRLSSSSSSSSSSFLVQLPFVVYLFCWFTSIVVSISGRLAMLRHWGVQAVDRNSKGHVRPKTLEKQRKKRPLLFVVCCLMSSPKDRLASSLGSLDHPCSLSYFNISFFFFFERFLHQSTLSGH